MTTISDIASVLAALSGIAVILGVPFVLLQLRQNARLVEASNRQIEAMVMQNKIQVILSIAERFNDPAFSVRRQHVREIVRAQRAKNWEGFLDSPDDFELRSFAAPRWRRSRSQRAAPYCHRVR